MSTSQVNVPFFKKKGSRPTTSRKRSASPGTSSSSIAQSVPSASSKSQVVLPGKKGGTSSLLSAGTKRKISEREYDYNNTDIVDTPTKDDGPDVKWSSAGSHLHTARDILAGDEAEEILAKRRKAEAVDDDIDDGPDDGLYKGQKGYKSHLQKNKEVPKAMRVGPQRNTSSTIRTVTIVDYQPDVCKDYKETGYCGFGDTCKFLHDRGTYLAGWQLDKLAETPRKQVGDNSDSDSDSDEDIPFACLICRNPYTDPVVTKCGHYFCSACAIKRFAKTPKCLACGAPTGGMFNRADKVIAKMNKKKEEEEEEERDASEASNVNVEIEGLAVESKGREPETGSDSEEEED
ncbi:hypothetical protein BDP27DRAFT_1207868 [Rhodocollybia butyracea]|uniref:Pre-mRNA-splicing factor CWC24 n=1 Tax=Rhodocollybia butyracea TaxID=206335 RepID=A0A9P5Q9L3_9AGAR|nr:hypothetical protein BDP27DRAFT_1207868 [Rhodocollybia butyracea]